MKPPMPFHLDMRDERKHVMKNATQAHVDFVIVGIVFWRVVLAGVGGGGGGWVVGGGGQSCLPRAHKPN